MKFNPPINKRSTKELLKIMESAEEWNPDAVDIALQELTNRNIPLKEIKTASFLGAKKKEQEMHRKAHLSYNIADFIPIIGVARIGELFEILFSWELKKDGFYRKAKQQKYFRLTLGIIILIAILVNKILE